MATSRETKPDSRSIWLRYLPLAGVLAVIGVVLYLFARVGFNPEAFLGKIDDTDPLAFFAAMAILPVFGFPVSVFYLYASAAFPLLEALLLCWGALAINMSASFFLARSILREPLERLLALRGWSVPDLKTSTHWQATIISRALPTPFLAQNMLLSLGGIPYPIYIAGSMIMQGLIALAFVGLGEYLLGQRGVGLWIAVGVVVLVYVAVKAVLLLIRRRRSRRPTGDESGALRPASPPAPRSSPATTTPSPPSRDSRP